MSRIEKALEKAALLREGGTPSESVDKPGQVNPVYTPLTSHVPPQSSGYTNDNPLLVTLQGAQSPVAEEYRKLKSFLLSITRKEKFKNALMVTSALGGEGKSLTSLNLAISLAHELDHTVLLVDADLRNPSIGKYLGIEAERGLSDYLRNGTDLNELLVRPGIGKLAFLPAGKMVGNPVELLASHRMRDLLNELKNRYPDRYIIIDTPPVLPFAETHALSQMVDGVLFVVREGVASTRNITEAIHSLKTANVMGVVYNASSQNEMVSRYGYYGYSAANGENQNTSGNDELEAEADGSRKHGLIKKLLKRAE